MINPLPKGSDRGPAAEVICDSCGASEVVRADYERKGANVFEVNFGQVVRKITSKGWSNVKNTMRCPACEEARRAAAKTNKETAMNAPATEAPRQPTRDQKREIIALLNEVYDTKAGRYTGGETDKTVADTIGGGVMLGWVAQIREDLFGPDGGNDEIVQLRYDVALMIEESAEAAKKCHEDIQSALGGLREYNKLRDKMNEAMARIEKLRKAVGPKGEGV